MSWRLWSLVEASIQQKKGALIVITNDAEEEAARLGGQSTRIKPVKVTAPDMELRTSIDGAVLLGQEGVCHAVGVILDGIATGVGDSSRGARYNSALRYVEGRTHCMAVVVSEDGMIDLVPDAGDRSQ